MKSIPDPVCVKVGQVLGVYYFNNRLINILFLENGAPINGPEEGLDADERCIGWLRLANDDPKTNAFRVLGGVLREFMDETYYPSDLTYDENRLFVERILEEYGLSYQEGGRILDTGASPASEELHLIIKSGDFSSLRPDYERAFDHIESDPAIAIAAACTIFEAFCKAYIESEGLTLPRTQTAAGLWRVVKESLKLHPGEKEDDDLKRILSGLASVVIGFASLRTHASSAHGQGKTRYTVKTRHARLAVNASHSLVLFLFEAWGKQP